MYQSSMVVELQQRAVEYLQLISGRLEKIRYEDLFFASGSMGGRG